MKQYIRIGEKDNVAVALVPLPKGFVLNDGTELIEDIDLGHKVALTDIKAGEPVIKYNNLIGFAFADIRRGEHVHTHNIRTSLGDNNTYVYEPVEIEKLSEEEAYFNGYLRENGKAGVRNEIWIIPTVGCVNSIVKRMEEKAKVFVGGSLEDVVAFNHPYGCSQMGDDQENTRQILADLINHPNAGGVLVVGLGCENSNIEDVPQIFPKLPGCFRFAADRIKRPRCPRKRLLISALRSKHDVRDHAHLLQQGHAASGKIVRP